MYLKLLSTLLLFISINLIYSQSGTEFWFAPPEVTSGHVTDNPVMLRIAAGNSAATVTISQPANVAGFNGGSPIVVTVPANSATTVDLSADLNNLETKPSNTILNTGLHISSTQKITCYYEINTGYNPDIYALKGPNGLGTEFYTPFQTAWRNGNYSPTPYTSFDIVATEDNTTVLIYPRKPLDGGHPALTSYTIVLNKGQTYSGSVTSTSGADNPAGTAIVSDKPIAVSIKDDSVWPQPAGCKDLNGDQLVPTNIVGYEYIVQKGGLTVPESAYITATQNNCIVTVGGTYVTTLFAGETYEIPITNASTYITCSQPAYCYHISGFGCESGGALLPPLNCAGSDQVNVVRSTTEYFALNILVPSGAEGNFAMNGNTTLIPASAFSPVPGTAGAWMAATIPFSIADVPTNTNQLITNTTEAFAVGIINGGATSGCRFGYFSEFAAKIDISAGVNQTICANDSAQLNGSVQGGSTTGIWTGGSGQFLPDATTLNAIYVPSPADISLGTITLTLTSTGNCTPVDDQMQLSFTPAPTANAGSDISVCENNPAVLLNGSVTIAASGVWSGGAGTYSPNSSTLTTTYTPTAAEIAAGNLVLTLTTTGNGVCNAESDNLIVSFTPAPTVDAGVSQTLCSNNAQANLNGSKTVATGVIWSGGGTFSPNVNALNPTYTPSSAELLSGSATITITTTGNGNCNAVTDNVTINYTPSPTVNAGADQTLCANNSAVNLNGSVTVATGGQWSGGLGTFIPNNNTLNATYYPTAGEIASGSLTLTLTTTGNGNCLPETDNMTVTFTPAPTVNAGSDITVCENNALVNLSGNITTATGAIWSGGSGTFSPNNTSLTTSYTPTAAEISGGSLTLVLTTTGNGNCNAESDSLVVTFTPAPTVDAGVSQTLCSNNSQANLNGSMTGASGIVWSGGGSFSPNANTLTPTYTPSATEITSGSATITITTTGNGSCNAVTDNVTINFTPSPTVNAGPDQSICSNNPAVTLNGSVTVATGGQWSGGLGTFIPNNNTLNATYYPTATEIASGSLTLTLTTTGNGNCLPETDNMTITFTPAPTVDAGLPQSVCSTSPTVNLSGAITLATGAVWSGGSGTFSPNATDLNATYTPSASEISSGSVQLMLTTTGNGNCLAENDSVVITIDPAPVVNAGPNTTSCANNSAVNLGGSVTNATGGIWSGGTGNYVSSNTDLNAVYTPSNAEVAAGNVTLTLTSTGTTSCPAVSDDITINILPSPTANAGADQTVCSNNATVTLIGSVTGASGGQWSGGLGTFSPSNNALNATYTPTATELLAGSLTLTLTTTGVGVCNPVSDDVVLTFTPAPVADAGIDITSCENNPQVTLNGNVTVATGGQWVGGTGSFSPNNTDLGATYTPSTAEITNGTVTLVLQTTGNGNCNMESDSVIITIDPSPVVDAGVDQTICSNNLNVTLSGQISGITNTGIWSTSGTGYFVPNNTALNANYVPSSADSTVGSVVLTLTSTNGNACLPVSDSMTVTILPAGIANAGTDVTVCANNATIPLNGSVSGGASGGTWSTNGSGVFIPDAQTLNASYIPSPADASNGTVTLTLTANSCDAHTDDLVVTITPAPVVNAGSDITVCANSLTIPLGGSVTGASTTGIWSTLGTGTFSPNSTTLNADYIASSQDSINQSITLILSATNIGSCAPVSDTLTINIFPTGTADAGSNVTVCANNANVQLNGTIGGGASTGEWNSSGSGTFVPNNTDMNAVYIPSSADIILGSVNISLTATNSCNNASDVIGITFTPAPVVDAGNDTSICGTNAVITLTGSVSGAVGGEWSTSGSGVFSPNPQSLTVTYNASQQDIAAGNVWIYLTSIGNGDCNAVVDSLQLSITTGINVNAGPDQTVCSSSSFTILQGSVTNGSSTGVWTTLGSGTFSPNAVSLTTEYHFGAGDIANGSVDLVLTSTGNGTCVAETDTLTITFGSSAFASAGSDFYMCESDASTQPLNGVVSGGATQGIWTTLGSGTFSPNATDLNASYTPSPTDLANGSFSLVLTTTDNGGCSPGSDTVTVFVEQSPLANAGVDIQACSSEDTVNLSGSVSNVTSGTWSTSGTGTFYPNDTTLNGSYLPSLSDLTSGSVQIYLTTSGSNICSNHTDSLTLTFADPLTIGFTNSTGCENNYMSFTDTTQVHFGSISSWSWDFGDGGTSQAPNPQHLFTTAGAYDVTLNVVSNLGCSYSLTQSVTVQSSPTADFTYTQGDIYVGDPVGFSDLSVGSVSWNWVFGDGFGTSIDQNPTYSYNSPGTFNVIQQVTNAFGCTDTAMTTITIISDENQFYPPVVPTGFSPNGDGENDILYVRGGPFKEVTLRVYNNWGELIFESNDINVGWDGKHKGKDLPIGDYIYSAIVIAEDGTEYKKKGSISIIR